MKTPLYNYKATCHCFDGQQQLCYTYNVTLKATNLGHAKVLANKKFTDHKDLYTIVIEVKPIITTLWPDRKIPVGKKINQVL